jgi:hypothetical protein
MPGDRVIPRCPRRWTRDDIEDHAVMVAARPDTVAITIGDTTHHIGPWDSGHGDALDALAELLDWLYLPHPS